MITTFEFCSYLFCLALPVAVGLRSFRTFPRSVKIIWILMVLTLVSELAAGLTGWLLRNNMVVYHLYTPVSFCLIALYYNYRLPFFKKYKLGYLAATAGIAAEIADTVLYHSYHQLDTYAILITAVCGLIMVMFEFGRGFLREHGSMLRDPHFQISLLLGVFWCSAALVLGSRLVFSPLQTVKRSSLQFLWFMNIAVHLGFGYVFFSLSHLKVNP